MIENPALVRERNEIDEKREVLTLEMRKLQQQLADMNINPNWISKFNSHVPKYREMPIMQQRHELRMKLDKVVERLRLLNGELQKNHEKSIVVQNRALIDIFKELFTGKQLDMINNEALRRIAGAPPSILNFGEKNKYRDERDNYKALAKDQIEKMIEFRILLTRIIEQGCETFGNAEFLKLISPLNRLIIPLKELNQIKLKNYL